MGASSQISQRNIRKRYELERAKRRIEILPPEGVPIHFEVASLGSRLGAQLLDLLITHVGLLLLFLLVIFNFSVPFSQVAAFFILLTFALRAPYYILTELVWNGRTIGKRLSGLRVISADGQRLSAYQIVVRNLMKELEVFLPITLLFGLGDASGETRIFMIVWLLMTFATPFFQKRNQRIGDIIAGTYVIALPKTDLTKELAQDEHYGRFELQTLESVLRSQSRVPGLEKREREVVEAICKKIGYLEPVRFEEGHTFLSEFYTAQRAFLEGRSLLGDKREDKFYQKKE
jgi:uncharacterized RDD family membrane protein YckC